MPKKKNENLVGKWAFILGLVIALLAAVLVNYAGTSIAWMMLILFVLGLVVGFINIREENTVKFLVAVSTLLILGVGSLSSVTVLTGLLGQLSAQVNLYISLIFGNFISFVGAAGLVVAIKAIVESSRK
jgi:hypothetical protein